MMRGRGLVASVVVLVALAAAVPRGPRETVTVARESAVSSGAPVRAIGAKCDTVYVLGGPDRWDGRFEDAAGAAQWHGWTGEDWSRDTSLSWQVSDHLPVSGALSMWCGAWFDGDSGYGNDWDQRLVFTHAVDDPQQAVTVRWTGVLRIDTEPGYDFVTIEVNRGGHWGWLNQSIDGARDIALDETVTFEPDDYVGEASDEIQLRIRFTSDAAYSDEDGYYNTHGAVRVDDLAVTVDGVLVDAEDFEDGAGQRWIAEAAPGVGSFAHLENNLQDLDPCRQNASWQVCFVDDGVVVPGTGGSTWPDFTYGPGGYVLNWTGGVSGLPNELLSSHVVSPVLALPAGRDGAMLSFDVYRPMNYAYPGLTVFFYVWHVRSTADEDPAALAGAPWRNHHFLYYGEEDYYRAEFDIAPVLEPGARWAQVALGVEELDAWYFTEGATPAPYFDNVAVKVYDHDGPALAAYETDLPRDAFPAQGRLDLSDLAGNSCRFDPAEAGGDSMVVSASAISSGAVLAAPPVLHVAVRPNAVFDPVRILPPGFSAAGGAIHGTATADSCRDASGNVEAGRWFFDLPDEGFLFPGDVLHHRVEATDVLDGLSRTTVWPADTTGYAAFEQDVYDPDAVVRFLPSVTADGRQPRTLLWNDAGTDHSAWWRIRLAEAAGLAAGADYDIYATRAPSAGCGDGLGAAASVDLLSGYDRVISTAGDRTSMTFVDEAPDRDLELLDAWLDLGRDLVLCGDGWLGDVVHQPLGLPFVQDRVGVAFLEYLHASGLDGQSSPQVAALDGNGVLPDGSVWRLHGDCPQLRQWDMMRAETAVPLAEYLTAAGEGGAYEASAMSLKTDATTGSRVLAMPWDLEAAARGGADGASTPATLLREILAFLDVSGEPVDAGDLPRALTAKAYPNPCNPRLVLAVDQPRAGVLSAKLYDLRGRLVRTLDAGNRPAGRHELIWTGDDDRGAPAPSGVYFYEIHAAGERRNGKIALVR